MYSSISIKSFRGIASLDAGGFRRVNLIVGRNNSGKTTFLESVYFLGCAHSHMLPTNLGRFRGHRGRPARHAQPIWRALFHNLNARIPVEIGARWAAESRDRSLRIEAQELAGSADHAETSTEREGSFASSIPDPVIGRLVCHFEDAAGEHPPLIARSDPITEIMAVGKEVRKDSPPITWISCQVPLDPHDDRERFGYCLKMRPDPDLIDALRVIEPGVRKIEILSEPSGPTPYLDLGFDGLVPLDSCGVGIIRLFSIALGLIDSKKGVLLIDQIDHGFHYSIMPGFWRFLDAMAEKHQVQVFGTTQNDEMIRSALEVFADKEGALGLFRIDKRGDRHVMVGYNDEAMKAVLEVPFEVRG
jgi:hypothetical protein